MSQVLIVEREPLIRLDIVALLENAGVEALEFESGAAAIGYMKDHKAEVAAIFTEANLEGESSGLELARFAASEAPSARVVVTSGRSNKAPRGMPAAARYLPKPWFPKDVVAEMTAAVDRHRRKAA